MISDKKKGLDELYLRKVHHLVPSCICFIHASYNWDESFNNNYKFSSGRKRKKQVQGLKKNVPLRQRAFWINSPGPVLNGLLAHLK